MAEDESTDESQKTEDPTPRKLEEARKRGQIVYSREINNWVVIFASTVLVVMAGPGITADLKDLFKNIIEQSYAIPMDPKGVTHLLETVFLRVGGDVLLPLALLTAAGVLSGFMQTGPLFTLDPLMPDLSKISVFKGIDRLFSRRAVMEFIKGIVKLLMVSIAGYMVLRPYFDGVEHFVGLDFSQTMFEMQFLFLRMMIAALSVLFVLAAVDYLFQREEFLKSMRMSKQEIKEEYKQTEGDPHIKGKLRRLREEKARRRMMADVPKADVVITNPTHYAVALKYDSKVMDAPVMLAKGVDAVALKIKEVAKEHNIPVVENAPLARALHSTMEIDEMIPREQYKAVAEVISYVFKLKGKKT